MMESSDCFLSITIPTYNEAENIPELIDRIEKTMKDKNFEIIIVDDNSNDGTADIAENLGKNYGNIKVIRRPRKMGLASAILDGIKVANGNIIAVMDADLQHPPELLPKMIKKIYEGYDIVIASRYVEEGGIEEWSILRRLISIGAISFAHLLFPRIRKIRDPISGFFYLRKV
jgi:dolichol-phosphate mannosyltransferase